MSNYETYAKATARLCAAASNGIDDLVGFSARARRLYNRIRKSPLTVYQKDSLLERIDRTLQLAAPHAASSPFIAAPKQKPAIARKSELLAA